MRAARIAIPSFILLLAWLAPLHSQAVLTLADGRGTVPIGRFVYLMEDAGSKLAIEQAASPQGQALFTRNAGDVVTFPKEYSAYWLRLSVRNESGSAERFVLVIEEPGLWNARLFSPEQAGGFSEQKAGYKYPFGERSIKSRAPSFPISVPPNETRVFYLRMSWVPSAARMVVSPERTFFSRDHDAQFVYGMYYGLMAVMLLFNLILFLFLRDASYLYLVLFIAAWTVNQMCMNGFAYEYLWPRSVVFNQMSLFLMTGLVDLTGLLFGINFLSLKKRFPGLYRASCAVMCLSLLQLVDGILEPFVDWAPLLRAGIDDAAVFLTVSLGIVMGAAALVKKHREARFFLLAWLSFLLGTILYILNDYRLVPDTPLTTNGMQIGSALIVVLMSVALADRYRLIRVEKEVAERTNAQRTDFFTNLSHEIKTPLTLISNYMDLYLNRHGPAEELDVVKRNVDKLLADMVNFFDVLKLERGAAMYDHGLISDLSDIVRQKTVLFESLARGRDIAFSCDAEGGLYAQADPLAVERIVNNLLENAIRYNRQGGSVRITLAGGDGKIRMCVEDTGIGIEAEQLKGIFLPYYQVSHKKRNIQGIGMGLSLVKGIVESLGGTVSVRSAPGEGSAFTVTLPSHRLRDGESVSREALVLRPVDPLPRPIEHAAGGHGAASQHSVLVVEDNAELLAFLRERLGERYRLATASDGYDALHKLAGMQPPDVIVSDIMMDGMDGYELFRRVAAMQDCQDVPFIFLTARSRVEERVEGLKLGAIDYIHKPFVVEELVSRIDSILRYRYIEKKLHEKDKFASLGMLLGGISHEILNPLSGITGPIDNLEKRLHESDLAGDEKVAKYLRYVRGSIVKIEALIGNLRILYSDRPLGREALDVAEAARPIIEEFRARCGDRIRFVVSIQGDARVQGDREALHQILRNLIGNAVEAISEAGTVTLTCGESEGTARIIVSDTGHGIPREDLDRVFDAFFSTKKSGKGVGLGLNIVKNLVLKMGWEITADSRIGEGASFTILARNGEE